MEGVGPNNNSTNRGPVLMEKKARPQEQLNCPRCNSTNTKFCYYNNYSLTQPRYFCKTCRRYWTEGGSLRNVPVGGGSRKNTKKPNNMISSSSLPKVPDLNPPISLSSSQSPKMLQGGGGGQGHDLNLAFPNSAMDHHKYHGMSTYVDMPKLETGDAGHHHSSIMASNSNYVQYSLMPNSSNDNNNASLYPPSGFPMQEVRPSLGFSFVDGLGNNRSSYNGVSENGRLLFPFGEIKHLSSAASGGGHVEAVEEQNKEQGNSTTGYWTGMIGEGSSW